MKLPKSYYNWTTDERNLFARLGAEINMFEPAQAGYNPVNQRGECVEDLGTSFSQAALANLEFEDLNTQCYQYLQDFDATSDMVSSANITSRNSAKMACIWLAFPLVSP